MWYIINNYSNKTQFYDRIIKIIFNKKDKVLNYKPLVPFPSYPNFFLKSWRGARVCCLCHAIHNLSTGRSDSYVRLPSSGQDVVYYCLLCTSPPYPATSTTAVGAEYHIQYHSGYLDILMQKDFLFWSSLSWEKLGMHWWHTAQWYWTSADLACDWMIFQLVSQCGNRVSYCLRLCLFC